MPTAGQPATIPDESLRRIGRWAQRHPVAVYVILYGSRARGDHRPESDRDIALVYEGKCPPLEDLPGELGGPRIEWVPMDRFRALDRLNACGTEHAVATGGRCLYGDPLPTAARRDPDTRDAWRFVA